MMSFLFFGGMYMKNKVIKKVKNIGMILTGAAISTAFFLLEKWAKSTKIKGFDTTLEYFDKYDRAPENIAGDIFATIKSSMPCRYKGFTDEQLLFLTKKGAEFLYDQLKESLYGKK